MLRTNILAGGLLVALQALSGCGTDEPVLVETEGTITYQGQPVPEASITFVPLEGGVPATGTSDYEGKFVLVTQGRPGALPGSHAVSIYAVKDQRPITSSDLNRLSSAEINRIRQPIIPERYFNTLTSNLTATVSEGEEPNHIEFNLSD